MTQYRVGPIIAQSGKNAHLEDDGVGHILYIINSEVTTVIPTLIIDGTQVVPKSWEHTESGGLPCHIASFGNLDCEAGLARWGDYWGIHVWRNRAGHIIDTSRKPDEFIGQWLPIKRKDIIN